MLSILIPIYNFDVRKFVNELHYQAKQAKVKFEIILIDDASKSKFQEINFELDKLEFVKYIQLNENIGRSKIRNLLAEKAKYNYLLFADCDMKIDNELFVENYVDVCKSAKVICGGLSYEKSKPEKFNEYFRWFYGTQREVKSVEDRKLKPNSSFMTSNFLIYKLIFESINFDENISQYGHEDTLFGIELKRKNIIIKHFDNPLIHIGLETCDDFISKTKKGIKNLVFITNNYNYPELFEDIKLLKIYKQTEKMSFIFSIVFRFFNKLIYKNLCGKNPSLKLFDLYKLSYLHSITKKRK